MTRDVLEWARVSAQEGRLVSAEAHAVVEELGATLFESGGFVDGCMRVHYARQLELHELHLLLE